MIYATSEQAPLGRAGCAILTSSWSHSPLATRYVAHRCSGILRFKDERKKLRSIDLRTLDWWLICKYENASPPSQSAKIGWTNDCACSYERQPPSRAIERQRTSDKRVFRIVTTLILPFSKSVVCASDPVASDFPVRSGKYRAI